MNSQSLSLQPQMMTQLKISADSLETAVGGYSADMLPVVFVKVPLKSVFYKLHLEPNEFFCNKS